MEHELRLKSDADAVPLARRFVSSRLRGALPDDVVSDAELAVTELVTNAILHAGTGIVVRLGIGPPTVRIEVEDGSPVTPVRPMASAQSMTGRGLALVEGLASQVGVDRTDGGKVVWCVLPATQERPVASHEGRPVSDDLISDDLVETILENWVPGLDRAPDPVLTVSLGDVPTDLLLAAKEHMDNLGREFALAASGASTGETAAMPADMATMVDTVLHRFAAPRRAIKVQALAAASRGDKRTTLTLALPLSAIGSAEAYLRALDQADAYARSARILTLETPPQHRAFRRWYVETIIEQLRYAATGGVPQIQETFEQHLLRELDTVSAAQAQAEALASRLAHLQKLTAELTGVTTTTDIADIVVGHAADAFGARFAALYVREGDELHVIRDKGFSSDSNSWARLPLDGQFPICEAVRDNTTVIVRGAQEVARRYPELATRPIDDVSVACMPLSLTDSSIGVIALTFPLYRDLGDPDELAFLSSLASACAQALDRTRALDALQASAAKLEFLSEASAELAGSLQTSTTLSNVAHLVVPRLGDWCSIEVVSGTELRSVGLVHVDPEKVELARAWQQMHPTSIDDDTGVARVIRTGVPELIPVITDDMLVAGSRSRQQLDVLRHLELSSAMVVPLTGPKGTLGAITMMYAESGRHYDDDDLVLAAELASRAAIAVDRAHQYDLQSGQLARITRIAETAQHAILAPVPARVGPVLLAGSYVSAAREALVGGDLYEVVSTKGGLRLLIGDVRGKGLEAVRLATVVLGFFRTAAVESRNLARLARQLDARLQPYLGDEDFVTALMLEITVDGACSIVSCGHPPPLLARGGALSEVACDPSPPLGLGARPEPSEIDLRKGDRLLLYTDGLIEARSPEGEFADLLDIAEPLHAGNLGAGLQGILTRLRTTTGGDLNDDLALLAAEYAPTTA